MHVEHSSAPESLRSPDIADTSLRSPLQRRSETFLAQSTEAMQEAPVPPEVDGHFDLVWVPIVMWSLAIFFVLRTLELGDVKKLVQHVVSTLPVARRVPCKGCQYLSENLYLKCAVNPKDVLTRRAFECRDYSPPGQQRSPENHSINCRR